jgi:hypothetical protein
MVDARVFCQCTAIGALGIDMGGNSSWEGTNTSERHFQIGAYRSNTQGTPLAPCLALDFWGFWRFRWAVGPGNRSLTAFAKQVSNVANRPSIVLKANPDVGLVADVTAVMGSSTDWIAATAAFVATGTGMVWVELHNNCLGIPDTCFFDRVSVV